MTADRSRTVADPPPEQDAREHVHLLMESGENRALLAEWLAAEYTVTQSNALDRSGEFDLCLIDDAALQADSDELRRCKDRAEPVFLPLLLVSPQSNPGREVWELVDDIVSVPVRKAELRARLSNLLERRHTSRQLAERERRLAETTAALERNKRAMDAAPIGVTITDPSQPDNPTVYANDAFEQLTGYDQDDVAGENMRLLQGPASDAGAIEAMREAIDRREPISETLINYRQDGTQFWNRVDIAPVRDESGAVTDFVGFQTDVTDQRIREQRLSVLNRLMRHNLSNDLNVIDGYVELLLDDIEDPERVASLEQIQTAATELQSLGEDARYIERLLDRCRTIEREVDVEERMTDVIEKLTDRYPDAQASLEIDAGPWTVSGYGLRAVFTEVIENAIEHNDAAEPRVDISVGPVDGEQIEIRIADNGPGVCADIIEMLRHGTETPLQHGDRLGLWLVYWVITLLGGDISLTNAESGGTVAVLTLPVSADAPN